MAKIERFYNLFQPEHYNVYLDINRQTKIIHGQTTITGQATQTQIAVNQKGLAVSEVLADGVAVPFEIDDEAEALRITLPVAPATVTLQVTYQTKLTDSLMGIYPSYYKVDGQSKQIVGTQFETTFARQAFPGIDEPEAKATFRLAIKFDEQPGETILANMPEDYEADGIHYFQPTVKMSTYLVAFAFGELQSKLTTTASGVQVGVFATKAHEAKELDFALDLAKRSIEFYEDFYHTPYPLPNSWQLALPDFSAGAMENWGLVTYREAYLLIDPENTSFDVKRLVATVITHELAHQWFGDLVTMKWWDDLWLNESFANMMEYVAVDALEPTWKIWELFQVSDVPAALERDATDGVQPVHVEVRNPAEIDALFDPAIVYAKGARMLVMVRALLGDDALRAGLKQYFADHQYGNAQGSDLWQALEDASGLKIGEIMHSWLEQPGYPMVHAQVNAEGQLVLTQQQFLIGAGQDQGRQWEIPLNGNYGTTKIMQERTLTVGDYQQLRQQAGEPFRLNVGNNSHYIVKYDQTLLADILQHAKSLSAIDQRQILQDLRLLAEAQQVSYADLVPLLQKFVTSPASIVNAEIYQIAQQLRIFVEPGSLAARQLRMLFAALSQATVARLGFVPKADESNDDQLVRPLALSAALYGKNEQVISEAHQLFGQYQENLVALNADVREQVLQSEVEHFANRELVTSLLQLYQQTSNASFKEDLRQALPHVQDPALLQQLVTEFKHADVIKPQDLRAWYRGVLQNPAGEQLAWDWLRENWDWLEATVGGDMEFSTYITVTAQIFHTPVRLAEFKDFFLPKIDVPGLGREIKLDTKLIAGKVSLVENEQKAVKLAIAATN
ncbi:Lysyl aminopeptidase [Fructilactobacillus florum 8D]|uniref:Aminopeptidase n=1 Tax=Fructilactobacillus florum 8D TaxID=1221538 RepID=W9EN17_9LACO|nr:M1 family metallopeptidase [Fructilactobacillus florum]EKK20168.1 Lysyl aminopeptidase [Fructilactobacillus florum 2F]ETO41049.1 Lysyl aminopeptidase [Fructilactobacillus florum 8D]